MISDPERYLKSIAEAVVSQSRQVRDLIGGRHWLSDGRHKEALLSDLIRRYCPAGTIVCSGFVLHPSDPSRCSREQDVLVLDALQEAPLFYHAGLAVAFPNTVLAAISVKTRFRKQEVADACGTLNSVIDVANEALVARPIWYGGFFFEDPEPSVTGTDLANTVKEVLEEIDSPRDAVATGATPQLGATVLATAARLFAKVSYSSDPARGSLTTYDTRLSSALFLAHMIDHIATRRGAHEASLITFADSSLAAQMSPTVTFDLPKGLPT
jgi:hypothetical protein